jgi:hypothetical protein
MVGIDPLSAYLGKAESWKDAEVRALLAPLAALAERRNVAIVGIMHLNKDSQRRALYRAQGSLAFVAAARAVHVVTADQDSPDRRLFLPLKLNIAAQPCGLAFTIPNDAGGPSRVTWQTDPVTVDAEEALGMSHLPEEQAERRDAVSFLSSVLAGGKIPAKEINRQTKENGISPRSLYRAKVALNVRSKREGGIADEGLWYWELPANIATKVTTSGGMEILEEPRTTNGESVHSSPKIANSEREVILDGNLSDQNVAWEEEL